MKFLTVSLILLTSLQSFAKEYAGAGMNLPFSYQQIPEFLENEFIINAPLELPLGTLIQNKMLMTGGENYFSDQKPFCFYYGKDAGELLRKIPLSEFEILKHGDNAHRIYYNGEAFLHCNNLKSINDLREVFTVKEKSKVFIPHVQKDVELLGITDEENPSAIVKKKDGHEETLLCEDLMFSNARLGFYKTGFPAFAKDLEAIVEVVALGRKNARVKNGNKTHDVEISNLGLIMKTQQEIPNGTDVFVLKEGKKVRGTILGISPQRNFYIKIGEKVEVVSPENVIRIKN